MICIINGVLVASSLGEKIPIYRNTLIMVNQHYQSDVTELGIGKRRAQSALVSGCEQV